MSEIDRIMRHYEIMNRARVRTAPPPPKCHFTYMNFEWNEDEEWWECPHCGHTKLIRHMEGER